MFFTVSGNEISFTATFNNLYSTQSTTFYLAEEDADLAYPLTSKTLTVNYVEMLNITAQVNVNELYIYFGEAVTFYKADGTAIAATATETVADQVAKNLVLYKNGVDTGLSFVAGYNNAHTFTFVYSGTTTVSGAGEYTFGLKDGMYFRSTSKPNKGYIGAPKAQYNGPLFAGSSRNMSSGILWFEIDAYDRTGASIPAFDFTKAAFSIAPAGTHNGGTYSGGSMTVLANVFVTTIELTYNGVTVTVDFPESGVLTVTEAMFPA